MAGAAIVPTVESRRLSRSADRIAKRPSHRRGCGVGCRSTGADASRVTVTGGSLWNGMLGSALM
jgi:hypothetical protein